MKEVSIIQLTNGQIIYRVTKTIPELMVSETKFFTSQTEAFMQFAKWSA